MTTGTMIYAPARGERYRLHTVVSVRKFRSSGGWVVLAVRGWGRNPVKIMDSDGDVFSYPDLWSAHATFLRYRV